MTAGMVQAAAFPYQVPADPTKLLVTAGEQFGQMLRQLWDHKIRYFDHETSGLEWYLDARSCGIGFGVMEQGRPQSWYVPFRHLTSETQLDIARIDTACRQLFADPLATWVAHHLKFDDHMNRREGWRIVGKRYCTQVAARLYDENALLGLEKRIVSDLGGDPEQVLFWKRRVLAEVALLAKARKMNITPYKQGFGYSEVSPTLLGHYACHDIEWVALLHTFYETWGLSSYFARIWETEMQLNEDLVDMEEHGQPIDVEYIGSLKQRLHHVTSTLEGEVTRQVRSTFGWRNFDPSKDNDVRKLLFGWLGIQPEKKTKAGRQHERAQYREMKKQGRNWTVDPKPEHWSVDREVLEGCRHAHPMMDSLITWREAHKIQTTWTDSILNKCDSNNILHGSFNQEGTTSGRLSSEGPNLQNFIHDSDKRAIAHSGKKLEEGGVDPWSIRRAFIMRPRTLRVYFDYCLAPETLVETTQGKKRIDSINPGDKVYSLSGRRITWGNVSRVAVVGRLPAYRVTFDNGESVVASADHRWPVRVRGKRVHRKGSAPFVLAEKRTDQLRPGERMIPMRRTRAMGYVHLYSYSAYEYSKEHAVVCEAEYGPRPKGFEVHHLDGDKGNNRGANVEYREVRQHRSEHSRRNYANQDHSSRLAGLRASMPRRNFWGPNNPNYGKRSGETRFCPHCGVGFYAYPSQPKKYCSQDCYWASVRGGNNHKVVSIEFLGDREMIAITVPKHQNFVLACGVVTYNSQIELRVLTWYTREPNMVETYLRGEDIHARTQDEVETLTGRRPSRRLAKIIAFGLVYGLTASGLSRQAGISEAEAGFFLDAFFQQYTGIAPYRDHFWNESRMRGNRCMNIFGRVRTIDYLSAKEGWLRGRAERQLFGSLIQGTAGELTKESIVRVSRWIKETGSEARLVSTIHDEISLDCPVREMTTVVPVVKHLMESYPEFDPIPIIVDGKYSTHNWAENQALPG